jgi:ubiquinone/menaquinone biosynthesis C-methylase UbiE
VIKEYTRQAEWYDDSTFQGYRWDIQLKTIEKMSLQSGMSVLELACGTGEGVFEVAGRLDGSGEVVGLDFTQAMLDQAQAKLDEFPHSNVTFALGDAADIPFEDGRFDYCFTTSAFHHMSDKLGVFREAQRVLKTGGRFLVADYCKDVLKMVLADYLAKLVERAHVGTTTSAELDQLFRDAGFQQVEMETMEMGRFWFSMIGIGVK